MRVEVEHRFSPEVLVFGKPLALTAPKPGEAADKHYSHALTGKRWTFNVTASHGQSDVVLHLASYEELGRPTPRHRFKVLKRWDWHDERNYHSGIPRAEVPVPLAVQHEAAEKISIIFIPHEGMKRAEVGPLGGKLN